MWIKPGYVDTDLLAGAKTPIKALSADQAASQIVLAIEDGAQIRYVPGFWRWIGLAVKLAPSFIMQRVNF